MIELYNTEKLKDIDLISKEFLDTYDPILSNTIKSSVNQKSNISNDILKIKNQMKLKSLTIKNSFDLKNLT
jgi:hypothetical protein